MTKGIRHIIFDLGGVLINLDYNRTEQAFIELGITNFGALYSQLRQTPLFDDFEIGKMSRADFLLGLKNACNTELSDDQVWNAWNAMLLDLPLRRLQLLQQLRIYYDLVLLSNTNEVHEEAFTKTLKDTNNIQLETFFDRVYYSHRIGMRKPSKEVFLHVLNENGFKAEHTLFIDDSPQHIEAAKGLGIKAIYLTPGMTIENDIFKPLR